MRILITSYDVEKSVQPIIVVKCISRHTLLTLDIRLISPSVRALYPFLSSSLSLFLTPSLRLHLRSTACTFDHCNRKPHTSRPSSFSFLALPPVSTPQLLFSLSPISLSLSPLPLPPSLILFLSFSFYPDYPTVFFFLFSFLSFVK